jgi:hypothetical protein
MKLTKKQQAALLSYARSVLAAIGAVVATGNFNMEDIAKAAVVAVLPPVLRWANPNDKAFGRTKSKRR